MTPSQVNDSNEAGCTRKRCVQTPGKQRIQDETPHAWDKVGGERGRTSEHHALMLGLKGGFFLFRVPGSR